MINDSQSSTDRLLKASEVAEILNVSISFVYKVMNIGDLRMVQLGGAKRVRQVDLANYINKCLSQSSPDEYLD